MRSVAARFHSLLVLSLGAGAIPLAHAASDVVISQVYGGGGNSGATLRNDFIELFNRGTSPIDLAGWSLQYASAGGSTWNNRTNLAGIIAPGQYFLVQQAAGAGGSVNLPTPDLTGNIALAGTAGKVALLNTTTEISSGTACPSGAGIVDFVGYGSANCAEGSPAPALSNTTAALRANNGATDTDNNAADFAVGAPNPRNSTTSAATVTLVAADPSAAELGADPGSFIVSRIGGNTAQALSVALNIAGSAVNGVDYTPLITSPVSIPANQLSTTLTLTPVNDTSAEGNETVVVSVAAGSYAIGSANVATLTIADDDQQDSAPTVNTTLPANGATEVALNTPLLVQFSEQVDVAAGAVSVQCAGDTPVTNPTALANVATVTLAPTGGWPAAATCSVTIAATGIADVDTSDPPNGLAAGYVGSFGTTASVCLAPDTPIGAIQGSGPSAALSGVRTVQGVVVGDYEGADPALRGFYLQNLPADADGDLATSDGLFVFNANRDEVSVGQVVQVTGTVSEFGFGSTGGTQTQIAAQTIEACGATASIAPTELGLPFASAEEPERYEGMLVRFPQALTVSEHFQLGRFGQVLLSGGARLPQPTNVLPPGAAANAQQAANALNQIYVDDELQAQNPDPIRFARGGNPLTAANTLRGGDTLPGLTGVMTQTDATTAGNVPATSDPVRYRVRPFSVLGATTTDFVAVNQRPASPPRAPGVLRVAGFNLLNYFNTFGATACGNGVGGSVAECRGADNAAEFERQAAKTVQAALGTQADILVVNEIENDGYGPGSALHDLAQRLNAATTPGNFAYVDVDSATGQVNALGTDAIKVGILYRPTTAVPIGTPAALNSGAFGQFTTTTGSTQRNRPALAQTFQQAGTTTQLTVVANHLKSKGSDCVDNVSPVGTDPDTGDGQGNCALTRTAAATQLLGWIATQPTGSATPHVLIMGDLNSYALEDPITTLTGAGYVNLIADRLGPLAYSYAFDGQWGYLDHALASGVLAPQVRVVAEWHINADEPNVLDYNTNFKSAAQLTSLYAADEFRTSDHDVVLVDIALDTDGDGLGDALEMMLGSDVSDTDSDDDGLADGEEDANRNGVVDAGETSPINRDTDGDGVQDGTELGRSSGVADPDGVGPLSGTDLSVFVPDADPSSTTLPTVADTDGDGALDGAEDGNRNGRVDAGETDPADPGSSPAAQQVPLLPPAGLAGLALMLGLFASRRVTCRHRR